MKGVAKRDLMLIFPLLIGNRNDMYHQIFTLSDGNRLAKSGGSFPYTKELAPGEEVSFEVACTGQGESSGEDDIVVNGIFTENETGETLAAEDRLTVVRVDF